MGEQFQGQWRLKPLVMLSKYSMLIEETIINQQLIKNLLNVRIFANYSLSPFLGLSTAGC